MKRTVLLGIMLNSIFLHTIAQDTPLGNDSIHLEQVVVTGTRQTTDVRHLPMTIQIIERERLELQHHTSVLPTLMQEIPNLFVTSRSMKGYGVSTGSSGNISMRGLSGGSGQMLVLIDGHPQYNGIYGHPIADAYQTFMTEKVEVLRGPASMLYGSSAMGGVMNIVSRKMEAEGSKTVLDLSGGSYGSLDAGVSNQYHRGIYNSTASIQYGRSDNHRPNMDFEQYSGYIRQGVRMGSHWDGYLNANVTHFNAQYPGSTIAPIYDAGQWITRGMVSAAVENDYEHTIGTISIFTNFGRHKIDDGTDDATKPTTRFFRSKDVFSGISLYQSMQFFCGNNITLGADFQHTYGHAYYTSKTTGKVLDTSNKQSARSYRNEVGIYADVRQDLASWLTLDAGVRFNHHSVSGTEWIPQFGAIFRTGEGSEVKLLASKGFRNPTMRELYLYPPSNEELRPERIWSYELSWRQRMERLSYGVNLFYIKGDNMIQTINRKNVNTGSIENCGVEMDASYQINPHWQLTTNHSYLHMTHKVVSAPRYKGGLGITYHLPRFSANMMLQHIDHLYTSVGNNATTETFTLLDLSFTYALTPSASLWCRGENLLGQSYEINRGYPMPHATASLGLRLTL